MKCQKKATFYYNMKEKGALVLNMNYQSRSFLNFCQSAKSIHNFALFCFAVNKYPFGFGVLAHRTKTAFWALGACEVLFPFYCDAY